MGAQLRGDHQLRLDSDDAPARRRHLHRHSRGVIAGYPKEKQVWLKPGDRLTTTIEKLGHTAVCSHLNFLRPTKGGTKHKETDE